MVACATFATAVLRADWLIEDELLPNVVTWSTFATALPACAGAAKAVSESARMTSCFFMRRSQLLKDRRPTSRQKRILHIILIICIIRVKQVNPSGKPAFRLLLV